MALDALLGEYTGARENSARVSGRVEHHIGRLKGVRASARQEEIRARSAVDDSILRGRGFGSPADDWYFLAFGEAPDERAQPYRDLFTTIEATHEPALITMGYWESYSLGEGGPGWDADDLTSRNIILLKAPSLAHGKAKFPLEGGFLHVHATDSAALRARSGRPPIIQQTYHDTLYLPASELSGYDASRSSADSWTFIQDWGSGDGRRIDIDVGYGACRKRMEDAGLARHYARMLSDIGLVVPDDLRPGVFGGLKLRNEARRNAGT